MMYYNRNFCVVHWFSNIERRQHLKIIQQTITDKGWKNSNENILNQGIHTIFIPNKKNLYITSIERNVYEGHYLAAY